MDASALELNLIKSITKYLRDSLPTTNFLFDLSAAEPDLRSKAIKSWIRVHFRSIGRSLLSESVVDFYVSTRKDPDGWDNVSLADSLINLFYDAEKTDGLKRIPLYDGSVSPWIAIGAIITQHVLEFPPRYVIEDETKVKIVSARFRWATKI
jgi:hypothetical protein